MHQNGVCFSELLFFILVWRSIGPINLSFLVFLQVGVLPCDQLTLQFLEVGNYQIKKRSVPVHAAYVRHSLIATCTNFSLSLHSKKNQTLYPITPIDTNFEGECAPKKRDFFVKVFQKMPKNGFFDLFFQKFGCGAENFGQNRVFF